MAHISTYKDAQGACIKQQRPGFSRGNHVAQIAFGGINSCRVPIYYTWVERDNICG